MAVSLMLIACLVMPIASAAEIQPRASIEEVVVTADYRDSTLMEIPLSVTVIGADQIRARNAVHLEDVLTMAPNVNLSAGASRARFFQIRGIGERGQFAEPLNSSVGLIIDGVDFSGVGTTALLFDVEQVEVLRGPQSTRYGANALAGLINVQTRDASQAREQQVLLEAGSHGTWAAGASISGPLSERVAFRLGAQQRRSDGFINNRFDNDETQDLDELVVRGKLDVVVTDALSIDTTLALIDIDNGYDAFSLDNNRNTRSDEPGQDQQRSILFASTAELTLDNGTLLEAIVGFSDSDIDYGYDEDWTFTGFHPFGYTSTDRYERDRQTVSVELRWRSDTGARLFNDSTDWTAGIYYIREDVELDRTYTFLPSVFSSEFETNRIAAFGELQTALSETLTLTTGLRIEHRGADYEDSDLVAFDPDEVLAAGRVALDWQFADNATAYLNLSRGFKAGGFNTDGSLDADLREFDAETLWGAELGLKGLYLDGRLSLRAALFHMQRDDVQIASSLVRLRSNGSSEFIDFTGNAAEGVNRGLELEGEFQITRSLTLFAAVGLLDTEYQDFINVNGDDLDGRDQAHAPNTQFNTGLSFDQGEGFFARLDVEGRGEFFFSDGHNAQSDGYTIVNLSAGWRRGPWEVQAYGRNLTGENYATRGFQFGNDPRTCDNPDPAACYAANTWIQLGAPRHGGVRISFNRGG